MLTLPETVLRLTHSSSAHQFQPLPPMTQGGVSPTSAEPKKSLAGSQNGR